MLIRPQDFGIGRLYWTVPEAVIVGDVATGQVVLMNPAAEALFGYVAAEASGLPLDALVPDRFKPQHRAGLARYLASGHGSLIDTGKAVELTALTRDGREIAIELILSPVEEPVVEGTYVVAIIRDITERKLAEQARAALAAEHTVRLQAEAAAAAGREERELLQVTLASIGDAVIATDATGRVSFLNPVAQALTGWAAADAVGRPLADIFPIINEQTRQPVESPTTRVMQEGVIVGLANHTILVARDGIERPIADSGAPIKRADGTIVGAVLVFRDVSAEREAQREQARLRAEAEAAQANLHRLFMEAPALIGILRGRAGVVELFNPLFQRLWGGREVLGKPMREAFAELAGQGWLELVERVYATGEPIFGTEREAWFDRDNDGQPEQAFFNFVYQATRNPAGEVDGVAIYGVDVTDLVVARQQAERAAARTARLQAVTAALAEALTPEQVAAAISAQTLDVLGAASAMIARLMDDQVTLELMGSVGYAPGQLESWQRFSLSTAVPLAEVVRTATPIWPGSPQERIAQYPHLEEAYRANPVGAWLSVPLMAHGRPIGGMSLGFAQTPSLDEADRAFVLALAQQCAQALDRARLYAAEQQLRTKAEAAQQRLAFLAEASEVLAGSLEYELTLSRLATLAVPGIADWCSIEMLRPDGTTDQLAVAHVDPAKVELARELRRRYPRDVNAAQGVPQVVRTGQAELLAEIPDALLGAAAHDAEHLRILRELGLRSAMIVPLTARGRTWGAITLVAAESGRRYERDDLVFAEELARRAALAIDNARLYREAQDAIRARDEFLSVAAHELRTPLATLTAQAQLALRQLDRTGQLDPERATRTLQAITHQAGRLSSLIAQLLDISRIQGGQLALEPRPTELRQLLADVAAAARTRTEAHQITVRAPAPVTALVDPLRLEQVLTNLLDNAIKYSPAGGPIELTLVQPSDTTVEFAVRDHGLGIPAERRHNIFERFYQAHGEGYRSGMGLGLYISRQIVELHGGTIAAEFPDDGGTCIRVRLLLDPSTPRNRSEA